MNAVLLDTTVASLLHPRKRASPLRACYEPHMRGKTLALSFQTVAELWQWAEIRQWGQTARQQLDSFLRRFLIIPYDYELTRVWARVMADCQRQGRCFEAGDGWIAATAVHHQLPLLTHDRDFSSCSIRGLQVITYA